MGKMITTLFIGVTVFILSFYFQFQVDEATTVVPSGVITTKSPPCIRLFDAIEKYSEKYGIPKRYAYGIAWNETRYDGPFHWNYDHRQVSSVGAAGAMQVTYPTAKFLFPERKFTAEDLKNDIDLNVECSMKLLQYLHNTYKDWKLAFGAYNTGYPIVNDYAVNVYNNKRK